MTFRKDDGVDAGVDQLSPRRRQCYIRASEKHPRRRQTRRNHGNSWSQEWKYNSRVAPSLRTLGTTYELGFQPFAEEATFCSLSFPFSSLRGPSSLLETRHDRRGGRRRANGERHPLARKSHCFQGRRGQGGPMDLTPHPPQVFGTLQYHADKTLDNIFSRGPASPSTHAWMPTVEHPILHMYPTHLASPRLLVPSWLKHGIHRKRHHIAQLNRRIVRNAVALEEAGDSCESYLDILTIANCYD